WAYLLQKAGIRGGLRLRAAGLRLRAAGLRLRAAGLRLRAAEAVLHGCCAGRGFVYIKPNGSVWPCPFLPIECGNAREESFRDIWNGSPVFRQLRRREISLKGQCRECVYRKICGGCRGRALALKGDYLEEDPSCFIHGETSHSEVSQSHGV
ncbi:MAG TPA: SPASM domain-containing protein, partial [Spirochaetia bacterium]|nr:SPASM domain-containing protein [Spirochaetia bacterium]